MRVVNRVHPFHLLQNEVDRLFSGFMSHPSVARTANLVSGRSFPALNVWETEHEYLVEAEVPGLASEAIDIAVVGNELTLKGERPTVESEGVTQLRRERATGEFSRTVTLPLEIDAEKVSARLENGVLMLTLPKAPSAKPRKIQVNAS